MLPGRRPKLKGDRVERAIVKRHLDMGIEAKRVPLSGAADGFKGDILIGQAPGQLRGEIKARASTAGLKRVLDWLADNDILFIQQDRQEPKVVMPWHTYEKLVGGFLANQQLAEAIRGRVVEESPTKSDGTGLLSPAPLSDSTPKPFPMWTCEEPYHD